MGCLAPVLEVIKRFSFSFPPRLLYLKRRQQHYGEDPKTSYTIRVQEVGTSMLSKDITYTQARANLAETLNDVEENRSVVVIRRRGRPGVALIAEEELSSLMETVHLLRSPANAQRLLDAISEVKTGSYETAPSIEALAEELGLEQEA
jgi:antitoxin YefM